MDVLLSTSYFPSVEYMACLLKASHVTIEKEETYPKQSLRNRCYLAGSQGVQMLSIPVVKTMGNHTPTSLIQIDESKVFRNHHFKTIQTLYRSAPFFEYYVDFIQDCIFFPEPNLFDYNLEIIRRLMNLLKIETPLTISENYQKTPDSKLDFRNNLTHKSSYGSFKVLKNSSYYVQVFDQKNGYIQNLSIIDLILNEGPSAMSILNNSHF